MAVLVSAHLTKAQYRVLTAKTMVVGLLSRMGATVRRADLTRSEFLESGRVDRIELLMLSPVRDHFVRVRADEVAFDAVEM